MQEVSTESDSVPALCRSSYVGDDVSAMSEIYREDINIAIWQRQLNNVLSLAAKHIVATNPRLQLSSIVTPSGVKKLLSSEVGVGPESECLCKDMEDLVIMFCYLFDLKEAGLRIRVLDEAMCPRFHVDKVPCRLVTTYCGSATQWLPNHLVRRNMLGSSNQGSSSKKSAVFENNESIRELRPGHVALLKGESWFNNTGGGLVHRSPSSDKSQGRLLMTLDFVGD